MGVVYTLIGSSGIIDRTRHSEAGHIRDVVVEPDGRAHLIAGGNPGLCSGICYFTRQSAIWLPPQPLGPIGADSLQVDRKGNPHVVWAQYAPGNPAMVSLYHASRADDGVWSRPYHITSAFATAAEFNVEMTINSTGGLDFLYSGQVDNTLGVYHVQSQVAATNESSVASQSIIVPPTASAPRLSFVYALLGAYAQNGTGLEVSIQGNGSSSVVLSTFTTRADWTHQSIDLAPWAGEAVTLTIATRQIAGAPYVWTEIDEVTIGSSYPDVWVTSTSPTARRGELVTYTLNFGNQGGAMANNAPITFTLPAGVTFGSASVPPASQSPALTWDVGSLAAKSGPNTITVTARVADNVPIPSMLNHMVSVQTTSAELETLNNSQRVVTTVQPFMIYLPLIQR